jgi:CS domain
MAELLQVSKYRMQWFQTESHMEINVFRKGIPSECVIVQIGKDQISIKIQMPGDEEPFQFQTILFGEVRSILFNSVQHNNLECFLRASFVDISDVLCCLMRNQVRSSGTRLDSCVYCINTG